MSGAIGEQLKHEEGQLLARAAAERANPAHKAYLLAQELGYRKGAQPQPLRMSNGESVTDQSNALKDYLRKLGSKGGKATGPRKARSSEQARAAVKARWAKAKARQAKSC